MEILEKERAYWKGMESYDYGIVSQLTEFPCIVASKNGVSEVDEITFKKLFEQGKDYKIKILNIGHVVERKLSTDTAVIAYEIEMETGMEGNTQKSTCSCTSTWIRKNEEWKCILHTEVENQAQE